MNTLSYERTDLGIWAGQVFQDTYRLGRRIGRGGMGEVYEAGHARLPGRFAVKILHASLAQNQEAFARFCREAEIMSALRHPHIVQIFDFNTTPEGLPYFVMEYLEGVDLQSRLAQLRQAGRAMPLVSTVRIVDAVASALGAAHAHGIVHRDLKPSNIFLMSVEGQAEDFVKVLDFGISKVRSASIRLSRGSEVFGTPQFMAPEQAMGQLDRIDPRTDQFSLAAIAYEMLTGHDAFVGDDPPALLYQVVHENPAPISRYVSWPADQVQAVLDRALAKEQAHRFSGIVEFAKAFEAAAESALCAVGTPVQVPRSGPLRLMPSAHATPTPAVRPVAAAPIQLTEPPRREPPRRELRAAAPAVVLDDDAPRVRAVAVTHDHLPARDELHDWDLPSTVDRVPVTHHRAAALGLVALGLAAVLIVKGWYRELPSAVLFVRANAAALTKHPVPLPQPNAAPDETAMQQPNPVPAPPPGAAAAAPVEQVEPPRETTPPTDGPAVEPPPPARTSSRTTSAAREPAHRESPRRAAAPPRRQAAEDVWPPPLDGAGNGTTAAAPSQPASSGSPAPAVAPAPAPAPASAGGFNIAPPSIEPAPRDLAPMAPAPALPADEPAPAATGDRPLPPSAP